MRVTQKLSASLNFQIRTTAKFSNYVMFKDSSMLQISTTFLI